MSIERDAIQSPALPSGRSRPFFRTADTIAVLALVVSVLLAGKIFPTNAFVFRADWLLHPFEQEHLTIAKHFAESGSLVIKDDWYGQSPGHGSEDKGYADGALVPRSVLLPYFIFAVPFLISDTAWLYVTPFFALAAAGGAGAVVYQRTRSRLGAAVAAVGLLTTAPILLNASGLAFENIIAVAFLLWGVAALERFCAAPTLRDGTIAGLLFGLTALTRADYAPAGFAAEGYLLVRLVQNRRQPSRYASDAARGTWAGAAVFALALISILVTNQILHEGALQSGYGSEAWQGSAGGVLGKLARFSPVDFMQGSRAFLIEIGKAQTALLVLGVTGLLVRRRFLSGDAVLLVLTAWLLYLHLGELGAHGSAQPFLVSSPPRYLQPVYATGVILGVEACHYFLKRLAPRLSFPIATWGLVAVALLAAATGLREAYTNPQGIPSADLNVSRLRGIYDFSRRHPDAVFLGDLNTKAVITGHTLIPRLLPDPEQVGQHVAQELQGGRRVFAVDDIRQIAGHPLYSGFYDRLQEGGFRFALVQENPVVVEVLPPGSDIADSLHAPRIDETIWNVFDASAPSHAFFPEQDGLHVRITPAASFTATLRTDCAVRGDFDARVAFRLINWPPGSTLRVGLARETGQGKPAIVGRLGDPAEAGYPGERYFADFEDGVYTRPTSDRSGVLRLTRSGGLRSAYVWRDGDWSLLAQHPAGTATDTVIAINVWGAPAQHAEVVLENFSLTAQEMRCPIPPLTTILPNDRRRTE